MHVQADADMRLHMLERELAQTQMDPLVLSAYALITCKMLVGNCRLTSTQEGTCGRGYTRTVMDSRAQTGLSLSTDAVDTCRQVQT